MKTLFRLWILSAALLLSANLHAMVLGDIQVASYLGQPLNARILFVDLPGPDALQLKVRMAGSDDYQKLGLQYPEGHKFHFQLVNQPGAQPFIRVFTQQPIDDPFINLLIEIAAPAGKLIKTYTFLLDPPADSPTPFVEMTQAALPAPPGLNAASGEADRRTPKVRRKKHHAIKAVAARPANHAQEDGHHMKLAMSLSISRYDPAAPPGTDALQEELIVKEKLLNDLKLQISEMEGMIKVLNGKRGPASGVSGAGETAASGTLAASVASGVYESAAPKIVPIVQPLAQPVTGLNWQYPAMLLIAILSGVLGLLWYRKRQHQYRQGTFDDLHDEPALPEVKVAAHVQPSDMPPVQVVQPLAAFEEKFAEPVFRADPTPLNYEEETQPLDERSMEEQAHNERRSEPVVPPEYAILMEANRHLRNGDDVLAEKALIRAIDVNPKNSYGYLALLKIYQQRADIASFANIAKKLKLMGDVVTFEEAAALGRTLDPDNPLYVAGTPD